METHELVIYGILGALNALFGVLGWRWIARKGYPELGWVMLLLSLLIGFVVPLLVISLLPGRGRPVARRSLRRVLPPARMPAAR